MGFHKHGVFSFSVNVQRMRIIGGDNFCADVTALRRHGPTGAAEAIEVPPIPEQYAESAREAEAAAIRVMRAWLDGESLPQSAPF